MELADLMNPQITFSKTTMDDILARYSVKAAASASTTNKVPASVKTQLSSLLQAKARVLGDRSDDDFGDLTWLTLENLRKPSKWPTARPLFDGAAHPNASANASVPLEPGTVRKNLENLRSVLYAAARHVQTLSLADTEKDRLLTAYDAAYQEMGNLAREMLDDEQKRLATRDPSGRQQAKWVPLPDLRRALRQVVQYLDNLQRAPPASMSIFEIKKMQRAMQFCLYTLIPPVRNNYTGLRFVTPAQETVAELTASSSPNYILVKDDGSMELVFNKYKIDGRSAAVDYDPTVDFRLDGPATRRLPLVPNATLNKFGFAPAELARLLTGYRALQQAIVGDRNPYDYVFFELKKAGPVARMTDDGMSTRMGRITQNLVGQTLGAQMLRTITVSWFNDRDPTMGERETIAEWMMHNVQTQLGTYTKDAGTKRKKTTLKGAGKRPRVTAKDLRI